MLKTACYRLLAAIPLVLVVSLFTFALVHLLPGSASETILGDAATPEAVAEMDQLLGLDRPLVPQYLNWGTSALQGDFGRSLINGRDVGETLTTRFPVSVSVGVAGLIVAVTVGLATGVYAGLREGKRADRWVSLLSASSLAVPNFWIAMLLAFWVGVRWGWLPAVGYTPLSESPVEWARGLILPGIAIGIGPAAVISRQMRSGLIDVLERPYIRTARSKGLSYRRVVAVHAIKNAMIPVVTVIGFTVPVMFGGAVIIEQIFGIPGIGASLVMAVQEQDIPVIQGVVMVTAVVVILVNVVIDISYAYFDPRVRVT